MAVQMFCVPSFMWLNTVTSHQYRHGCCLRQAVRNLYSEGGVPRFYRGIIPALLHSPALRCASLAANEGLVVTEHKELSHSTCALLASCVAATSRMLLMPIDAWRTAKQVNDTEGLSMLINKARKRPVALWHGATGSILSAVVSNYVWCLSNNWLRRELPTSSFQSKHARNATIGFCSTVLSDTCSNVFRVLKTVKQTTSEHQGYAACAKDIIRQHGIRSLFTRGLGPRTVQGGLQGAVFFLGYQACLDALGDS